MSEQPQSRPDTQYGGSTSPRREDPTIDESGTQPPDRRGTPPGMSTQDVDDRSDVARFLGVAAFPADRDGLLAVARDNDASDRVLTLLGRLPAGQEFGNVQEVAEAVGLGTEERRT